MSRRTCALLAVIVTLVLSLTLPTLPAGASRARAVDPATLALPQSALPAGSVIDHSGVSDNNDADGRTTPPDGFKAQFALLHQTLYENLGRITGYRMDFHYQVQGTQIGTEYMASVFSTADQAKAAMNDAIGPGTLIDLIGHPLPHQCSTGDACKAYYGQNPGTPYNAVLAIFTHGPIMVETASEVPSASFDQLEPSMETTLFGFLAAADAQVKVALNGTGPSTNPSATATAQPTDTPVPTAVPTAKPAPPKKVKCKKGYQLVKGKCKKKKKKKP
jgi:hypothetical protein